MQSAHHGACECIPSAHHGACPSLPPVALALGECGAARCARGGRARHALDHLRSGVISCRSRGTRARACKCSPRRPVPPLPQVISYRYRDTHEDIRAACISALGRGLRVLPSFCDDKHLKYMGWQLSDLQSAAVRFACTLHACARMLTTAPPLPPAPRRCASRRCRRSRTCTRPLTRSRI